MRSRAAARCWTCATAGTALLLDSACTSISSFFPRAKKIQKTITFTSAAVEDGIDILCSFCIDFVFLLVYFTSVPLLFKAAAGSDELERKKMVSMAAQ